MAIKFDNTLNLPNLVGLVLIMLSAYGVYRSDIANLREKDIEVLALIRVSDESIKGRVIALEARLSKVEADQVAARADRDLMIRMDARLQRIEAQTSTRDAPR